jgi:hypothetical protein
MTFWFLKVTLFLNEMDDCQLFKKDCTIEFVTRVLSGICYWDGKKELLPEYAVCLFYHCLITMSFILLFFFQWLDSPLRA